MSSCLVFDVAWLVCWYRIPGAICGDCIRPRPPTYVVFCALPCLALPCLALPLSWIDLAWLEQESAELSQARARVDNLLEELEGAKEGLHRSNARASELQRRHLEGR